VAVNFDGQNIFNKRLGKMSYVVVNVASAECESPRAAFPDGTHAVAKSEGSKGQIG
jgi:hypothetical protein